MNLSQKKKIAKALLKHAESMDDWAKPVQSKRRFTLQKANSFFVGVLLDRQINATQAWNAAEWIVESIGDENSGFWESLTTIEEERLEGFMRYGWGGKAFHRHWKTMAVNLQSCAEIIEDNYMGDPRKIWTGERCVSTVRDRFEEFPGIGPALSRMAVLILVRNYGLIGGEDSLRKLDVKNDVLLKRIFQRTGLVSSNAPDDSYWNVARELNPDFPAALDPPAWDIGRRFCSTNDPNCPECPLDSHCPKTGV